jgi:nitrate reductase NapAB chaperone NapD
MKKLIYVLALSFMAAPSMAVEVEGNTLKLTDAEVATCAQEGGCIVITSESLNAIVNMAYARGMRDAKGSI